MEQISAEVWHDSIRETVESAIHDMQLRDQFPPESVPPTAPPTPRSNAPQTPRSKARQQPQQNLEQQLQPQVQAQL